MPFESEQLPKVRLEPGLGEGKDDSSVGEPEGQLGRPVVHVGGRVGLVDLESARPGVALGGRVHVPHQALVVRPLQEGGDGGDQVVGVAVVVGGGVATGGEHTGDDTAVAIARSMSMTLYLKNGSPTIDAPARSSQAASLGCSGGRTSPMFCMVTTAAMAA